MLEKQNVCILSHCSELNIQGKQTTEGENLITPIDQENSSATVVSPTTVNYSSQNAPTVVQVRPSKPEFTYPQLLTFCLQECGPLPVKEIYKWMSDQYPCFRLDNPVWKNAVRHNLSSLPQFIKGQKLQSNGHIWYLDYKLVNENLFRRGRPSFFKKEPAEYSLSGLPFVATTDQFPHYGGYESSQKLESKPYLFNQVSVPVIDMTQPGGAVNLGNEIIEVLPYEYCNVAINDLENTAPNMQHERDCQDLLSSSSLDLEIFFRDFVPPEGAL